MQDIESIELEIEYNLKKPQEYLPKKAIKSIINNQKILHYTFDTN